MPVRILLIICLSALGFHTALAAGKEPTRIFVLCGETYGDSAAYYANAYERVIADYLSREFPCARVTTNADIKLKLDRERFEQLMGSSDSWPDFCKDLATEYLVVLELKYLLSDQLVASAACFYYHEQEPIIPVGRFADYSSGSRNFAGIKALVNKVGKKFVDELARKNEICAYTGSVDVKMHAETDEKKEDTYSVYCNMMDGDYKKETTLKKTSDNHFDLKKEGKYFTTGTVTYTLEESSTMEEMNDCYSCINAATQQKKEGRQYLSESQSGSYQSSGLSEESELNGEKIQDARVELTFLPDNQYVIRIKASSKPSTMTLYRQSESSGVCGVTPPKTDKVSRKVDAGINQVFGPYSGSGKDKTLQQKITIPFDNPGNSEKGTIELEFILKRD